MLYIILCVSYVQANAYIYEKDEIPILSEVPEVEII